jgi:glycogen debranching enzyme
MDDTARATLSGYLSYGTKSEKGLINQGWKDSDNVIVNADGSLAQPPLALVEAQAYAYRAKLDIASLLRSTEAGPRAGALQRAADDRKRRFNDEFWMGDKRFYALALERDRNVVCAVASNPGHTLLTRIITDDSVQTIADRLMAKDVFCGWGFRTLASTERADNPLDYQVGSIWPHDNALIALGLRRRGLKEDMERVFTGIFQAATHFDECRLPEVFDGCSQEQYGLPVPYPVACSPQAWAAGALPLLLSAALGLEPQATQHSTASSSTARTCPPGSPMSPSTAATSARQRLTCVIGAPTIRRSSLCSAARAPST